MAKAHDTIAHEWAHQVGSGARGFNMFYDGETIYSYGRHFPIARLYWDKSAREYVVLMTTETASVSTAKHKTITWRACHHMRTFNVPVVDVNYRGMSGSDWHKVNVEDYHKRITDNLERATRRRIASYAQHDIDSAAALVEECNAYRAHFKVMSKTKAAVMPDMDEFRAQLTERRAAELVREEELRAAEKARQEAARLKFLEEDLPKWREGETVDVPWFSGKHYLRLRDDYIETSGRASFPVSDARRAWPLLQHQRRKLDGGAARIDINARVGSWALSHMTKEGVRAGCHFIEWGELDRMAHSLGLEHRSYRNDQ